MTSNFPSDRDDESSVVAWDEALDRMELRFTLGNDPSLIYPLVAYLRERTIRVRPLLDHVGKARGHCAGRGAFELALPRQPGA